MVHRYSGYPGGLKSETLRRACSAASPPTPSASASAACCRRARSAVSRSRSSRCTPARAPARRPGPRRPRIRQRPRPAEHPDERRDPHGHQAAHPDHRPPQGGRRPRPPASRHRRAHHQRPRVRRLLHRPPCSAWSSPRRCASPSTEETYDVDATMHGGGVSGQAGALRMAIARALVELDPEARAGAEEGRPAHPRPAQEGEQEVRPQQGPQGPAVHQALIRARARLAGRRDTAVRHRRCPRRRAHRADHRRYVARSARAAAEVLGGGRWLVGRDTRESGPRARGGARRRTRALRRDVELARCRADARRSRTLAARRGVSRRR